MRKPLILFVFLLLEVWEVGGTVHNNEQIIENTDYLAKNENHYEKLPDNKLYVEGSTKWNIDLADMLNFDRLESELEVEKYLSDDEIKHQGSSSKNEEKEDAKETKGNDEYGGEDINAPTDQDEGVDFKTKVQEYVLRYVNLFLNLLNLQDKKGLEEDDEEVVYFSFVITAKDLKALQDLSKNFGHQDVFDHLYLIDSIISKGIHVKEKYSFYEGITAFFSKAEFPREFFISKASYFYIFLGAGLSMLLAKNLIGLSYKLIAFIFVNNMILMEGLFDYFRKIKEANIADYVDRIQYTTEYDVCNNEGRTFFSKLYDMFYGNQCLNYHKNLQISRADSIFPLESIMNTYAFYFVEIPCKILGTAINAFVVNVNAYLPVILRQLGQATTQLCVMGFLAFAFIVYFATPQFTIALLGARLHVNFGRFVMATQPISLRHYRRILQLRRSALNEIENMTEEQQASQLGEGLQSIFQEAENVVQEIERMEIEDIQDLSTEDELELFEDDLGSDSELFFAPDDKYLAEYVETTERLLDELEMAD